MSQLQELAKRVEHLLLRYEELLRTNSLLEQQVHHLEQEQALIQMRLNTARNRVDSLLSKIPNEHPIMAPEKQEQEQNITAPTTHILVPQINLDN